MLDKNKKNTVIALGFFDSVHLGHQHVIKSAKKYADKNNLTLTVFTFIGNVKAVFRGEQEKSIYSATEREKFLKELGADQIYFAPISKEFLSQDKKTFLDNLNKEFNISCYVSGKDYTFGAFGEGNVDFLSKYAKERNQEQIVVDTFNLFDKKVSTTLVKEYLAKGDVKKVNTLLDRAYSIRGKVEKGRQVGSKIGYPTANISIDNDRFLLKDGVYVGSIKIKGKKYLSIVNYGARPTFNLKEKLIEAHIIDFSGDIYGKEVEIKFLDFIREVKKFDDIEKLKGQLENDVCFAKGKKYD